MLQPAQEEQPEDRHGDHFLSKPAPGWVMPALLLAVAVFLVQVHRILPPFVIAAALAYIFSPIVAWIEKRARLPRPPAVFLLLLLILGPLAAAMWFVEPVLVRETQELAINAPTIVTNLLVQLFGAESVVILGQTVDANSMTIYLLQAVLNILGTPTRAFQVAATVLETLLDLFLSLVLLAYFLLDPRPFARGLLRLIPPEYRPEWEKVGQEIHEVLGRYVRGLLFLVGLMSAATWIGLSLFLHVPYALPIAVATGFLEIIPFLGPVVATTIAAVVGLSHGGVSLAIAIGVFYLVLRQLEDQLVMPNVLGHAVQLHPVANIFAVLAGGAVGGVLGALLGIPIAAALKVAFDHWRPA